MRCHVQYLDILLFCFHTILFLPCGINGDKLRTKRHVIYPYGGTFKLVLGFAMPVKLGLKQSMVFAVNFQFQYALPQNYSYFSDYPPIIGKTQRKREIGAGDRVLTYRGIEAMMTRYELNGRSCLLRSICDNAYNSLYHEANGLFGQLLHIILTPSYGDGEIDPDLDIAYSDAEKAGEYGADCISLYPDCPYGRGILDIISLLDT